MGVDIKLVLSDQEQLIYHCMTIVEYASQITAKLSNINSTISSLSSQGAFHDLVAGRSTNNGFTNYVLKAQEFGTLAEVLWQHAQNTYDGMVDVDKVMATYVAGLLLESPDTSSEDRDYIYSNPKEAVQQIQENIKEQEKEGSEKGN